MSEILCYGLVLLSLHAPSGLQIRDSHRGSLIGTEFDSVEAIQENLFDMYKSFFKLHVSRKLGGWNPTCKIILKCKRILCPKVYDIILPFISSISLSLSAFSHTFFLFPSYYLISHHSPYPPAFWPENTMESKL